MTGFRQTDGGLVNREKVISWYFNGRKLTAYEGDTIASAILANGIMLVGRSFKYHRPRGVMSDGLEEGGALFNVHDGARRIANVKGTVTELTDNMRVYSQNAFPSLQFDIGAVNSLLAGFITAGFYYKTFMGVARSTRFWMFCERYIRKAAGLGSASKQDDPDCYDIANCFCDHLVIGTGPAGLRAAVKLAEAGQSVLLVEQDFQPGGYLLTSGQAGDLVWRDQMLKRFKRAGGRLMLRSTAFGLYDGQVVGVLERVTDNIVAADIHIPREIFHIIHARKIILATGATERGLAFGNNDRPGVMLAHALTSYACRYGVLAGQSCVIATCHDGSYDDAIQLAKMGMQVTLIDSRLKKSLKYDQTQAHDISVLNGMVPVDVIGNRAVAAVKIAPVDADHMAALNASVIGCDILGMSGGFSPVIHLLSHRGVKPQWDERLHAFRAGKTNEDIFIIGSADGHYEHQACLDSADYLVHRLLKLPALKRPKRGLKGGIAPLFEIQLKGHKLKSFIDPQHDVTAEDIRQAQREGFVSVEHMKRYTTLGMATDQGRMGNVNGLAIMAQALDQPIADTGITTFRPPFSPVSIGALAGRNRGADWRPVRRTPMHHAHLKSGAVMTDAGIWKRAWYYPVNNENLEDAYIREAATTRQNVAMVDVSTLGKIAIQGPDATEFLNRIYVNPFAKLPVGKARYGVMLRDDGMVFDDGTTWRLAENDYFMTTTTAQAGPVMLFLEELLQRRWTDLQVHVTSVSDQWAGMAVAGPHVRSVLSEQFPEIDWSDQQFPFMGVRQLYINRNGKRFECRVARISFSGERAFEIYVPADQGEAVWCALETEIIKAGGCLYGLEALGTLRIEKGHVTAAELDGRVTIEDAGLARMVAKNKPFIGHVLRKRPYLQKTDRPQLVGIFPKDRTQTFSAGSILCHPEQVSGFGEGWITAVTHSPVLGHWIGLGFISGGSASWEGREVIVADPVRDNFVEAQIVSPHMFDPSGERQHG